MKIVDDGVTEEWIDEPGDEPVVFDGGGLSQEAHLVDMAEALLERACKCESPPPGMVKAIEGLKRATDDFSNAERGIGPKRMSDFEYGFFFGEAFERLRVWVDATAVNKYLNTKRGGSETGQDRHDEAQAKYSRIRAAYEDISERYPSKNRAIEVLNSKHGWSKSTIKRALKK